jgi:U3 small nucleolar RNA-associated protein 13
VAAVSAVAFSKRGRGFFVSGGADKLLKVWSLPAALAERPAGAELAGADAAPAVLLASAAVAAHDKDVNAVAVSPNDALVCTASQDRTAKVKRHGGRSLAA